MLEDVDFKDFCFTQVTVDDKEDKKPTEDANVKVELLKDDIGKIAREMQTRKPRKDLTRFLAKKDMGGAQIVVIICKHYLRHFSGMPALGRSL